MQSDLGTLLWRVSQNVEGWARTPEEARKGVFAAHAAEQRRSLMEGAAIPELIRPAIETLGKLLTIPSGISHQEVSRAYETISEWASSCGFPRTALTFAEAGAEASPHDAMAAYRVGQTARRTAEFDRSEAWYRRAIALGRRNKDWGAYGIAKVGLGGLFFQKGAVPAAKDVLVSALKAARKYRLWNVRGPALHDLFCIAANGGADAEADRLAAAALRAYGRKSDKLPRLAHDVAMAWILQGRFHRALPVLRALVRSTADPSLRLPFLSTLARAAGAAGDRNLFSAAWEDSWEIIHQHQSTQYLPDSLINLARGAATLNDADRAQTAAQYALAVALYRKEAHARLAAESILDSLSRAEAHAEPYAPVERTDENVEDRLAELFVNALSTSGAAS